MLKSGLVPSRLVHPAERKPVEIREVRPPSGLRAVEFSMKAFRWLLHVLSLRFRGQLTSEAFAVTVRELFESLGGLWIKVGQLLSLRVDMLPVELCNELARLQGQSGGFSPRLAREILERELGRPVEDVFDEYEDLPFAAASIGQIHRAHLRRENAWVAVKIQRPYLEEIFARDLGIVRFLFYLLKLFRIYPFMHWETGLRELGGMMHEELDCRYEASAFRRMKKSLRDHGIYVPRVFSRYTTKRIVLSEFIHSALVADYIRVSQTDPARLSAWLRENNIDPHKVALRLFSSAFRQLFEDNLYHGDMHPGNILLLRNSQVALIDFGAVSVTELGDWQKARLFVTGLITGDYEKAAETSFLLCGSLPNIDLEHVKEKVLEALRGWGARTLVSDLPYREKSIYNAFSKIGKILFQNKFAMQWTMMRLGRAAATLDGAILYLNPDLDTAAAFRLSIRNAERRALRKTLGSQFLPNLIKGLASAVEISQSLYEQAVYQGSTIRRQAQVFEGTTSKFAYLLAVLYRQVSRLFFLLVTFMIFGFFYQHHRDLVQSFTGPQLTRMLMLLPELDSQVWLILIIVGLYLFVGSIRLSRVLGAKESSERR
jgi:ubiquinone biosynthesis protein